MSLALVGIVWLAMNVAVVMFLRTPAGRQRERLIVSFPGAWIIVGLPLALSFGASVLITVFALF